MNDFVDWDTGILFEDDVLGMNKPEWRAKLKADTDTFLANGGEVEYLPYNPIPEMAARVGYWRPMGTEELNEMLDVDEDNETIVY